MKTNKEKTFNILFILIIVLLIIFVIRKDIYDYYYYKIDPIFNKNITQNVELPNQDQVETLKENQLPIKISGTLKLIKEFTDLEQNNTILIQDKIIELTNKQRIENGNLSILQENTKLNFSAEKKVQDMLVKQYFEHTSPSNIGVADLAHEVSYDYILIGENLAMGNFENEEVLIEAWMASPGHRANILNENYTEIGIALSKSIFEGKEIWMIVQHFGLPQSACPVIDPVLEEIIKYNQNKINTYEEEIKILLEDINNREVSRGEGDKELVNEYNKLVVIYNRLVTETKTKINEYNEQVGSFNDCILEKTAN